MFDCFSKHLVYQFQENAFVHTDLGDIVNNSGACFSKKKNLASQIDAKQDTTIICKT